MVNVCGLPGVAEPDGDLSLPSSDSFTQLSGRTLVSVSKTARSPDGGYVFLSQSVVWRSVTGVLADATARMADTFAWNRPSACGSSEVRRACSSVVNAGVVHWCGSSAAESDAATSAGRTGWLK